MNVFIHYLLFCVIFANVHSWRLFHNGRVQGGNLGNLAGYKLTDLQDVSSGWITQYLDHFDVENTFRWQQRYFINDDYFDQDKRNVAFLMLGGEGEASDSWMYYGAWIENARNSSAILFELEHRFYGQSRPTEDLSVENLKYLTSEQALADTASFISAMNAEYRLSADVKWIVFGGSYSGSLAAWARLKYPDLIYGAISTSGPLLALPNFSDYFKVVGDDLREISENCFTNVNTGTAQIVSNLETVAGQIQLTELFKLCDPIQNHVDNASEVANFFNALASNFALIAQYNNILTFLGNLNLEYICEHMSSVSPGNEIEGLAWVNSVVLAAYGQLCIEYSYSSMIDAMKDVTWDSSVSDGARQWYFQTCNEFGFYQTSDNQPQFLGDRFPLDFYIQQCIDIFGPQFNGTYVDAVTNKTNTIYGGLDINITRTVFVHGSVDPWHPLGITETRSKDAPAILINGTAHCANMYPASDNDPPGLQAARNQIADYIWAWLNS